MIKINILKKKEKKVYISILKKKKIKERITHIKACNYGEVSKKEEFQEGLT